MDLCLSPELNSRSDQPVESLQIHVRISFPFLRAKDLRMSLLIMRTSIINSSVRMGHIRQVIVHLVQKYFPHDCSTDIIFCREQKKANSKNTEAR